MVFYVVDGEIVHNINAFRPPRATEAPSLPTSSTGVQLPGCRFIGCKESPEDRHLCVQRHY